MRLTQLSLWFSAHFLDGSIFCHFIHFSEKPCLKGFKPGNEARKKMSLDYKTVVNNYTKIKEVFVP